MEKLGIEGQDLDGKRVIMRVDFNIPLGPNGKCADDTRIKASIPTIKLILEKGAKVILLSHLGRPNGCVDLKYSLKPCIQVLEELLAQKVQFCTDCIGNVAKGAIEKMKNGDVLLLENVRFHPGEENPELDPEFSKKLSCLGDVYVNDAFGTAHRKHTSTYLLPKRFPEKALAGTLLLREIAYLNHLFLKPPHPFIAIIGGAKLSSKLGVLGALLKKADALIIGGGMAFTFLKAQGFEIGNSLVEDKFLAEAKKLLQEAKKRGKEILLPKDLIVTSEVQEGAEFELIESISGVPKGMMGVDIGPKTCKEVKRVLQGAKAIFWNGPMGVAEIPEFAKGTAFVGKELADSDATTVVGGGDSVAAVEKLGISDSMDHISTGGGASLELIEMGTLPAIDSLSSI